MDRTQADTAQPAFFGSTSRNWGLRRYRNYDDDDERYERSWSSSGTYRTLCVRLCDGFYFPISFAATRDRFRRDAKTCDDSCSGQARLFVYANPGADVEDMVDLHGRPYSDLSTAFRYRTEYVASCKCKPNPWEPEARERHRVYALVEAKRKGDKQAAAELAAIVAQRKLDETAKPSTAATPPESPSVTAEPAADPPRRADRTEDRASRMGLGARSAPEPRNRSSRGWGNEPEWMRRAYGWGQ